MTAAFEGSVQAHSDPGLLLKLLSPRSANVPWPPVLKQCQSGSSLPQLQWKIEFMVPMTQFRLTLNLL